MKKYFFGWSNIKNGILEFIKMYSADKSFFSKKRVESGVAFIIAQWGMIYFLIHKLESMEITDLVMWASIEFTISGYYVSQIQKEKKNETTKSENTDENSEGELEQINS